MTEDIDMSTPIHSDDERPGPSAAAHKVHWDLERGVSLQGAMDARDVTREEEEASYQRKNSKQYREHKKSKDSEKWGRGRVEVLNERDRMDEHEAREERLRRRRREDRRRREKEREKERLRDEEAALEEEETSSLDDRPAEKRVTPTSKSSSFPLSLIVVAKHLIHQKKHHMTLKKTSQRRQRIWIPPQMKEHRMPHLVLHQLLDSPRSINRKERMKWR